MKRREPPRTFSIPVAGSAGSCSTNAGVQTPLGERPRNLRRDSSEPAGRPSAPCDGPPGTTSAFHADHVSVSSGSAPLKFHGPESMLLPAPVAARGSSLDSKVSRSRSETTATFRAARDVAVGAAASGRESSPPAACTSVLGRDRHCCLSAATRWAKAPSARCQNLPRGSAGMTDVIRITILPPAAASRATRLIASTMLVTCRSRINKVLSITKAIFRVMPPSHLTPATWAALSATTWVLG